MVNHIIEGCSRVVKKVVSSVSASGTVFRSMLSLISAEDQPDLYLQLFALYCQDLQTDDPKEIIFANPGYSRTGKEQILRGGVSDPRNRGLMKMFNLIDIGERAGSGIPKILEIWRDAGMKEPI